MVIQVYLIDLWNIFGCNGALDAHDICLQRVAVLYKGAHAFLKGFIIGFGLLDDHGFSVFVPDTVQKIDEAVAVFLAFADFVHAQPRIRRKIIRTLL